MEDLVQEYRQGKRDLARRIRELEGRLLATDDIVEEMDLKHDISLMSGMVRSMGEAISLMTNSHYQLRGNSKDPNKTERKIIFMDPDHLNVLNIPAEQMDPEAEDYVRSSVYDELQLVVDKNMELLTNKERSTVHRWIFQNMSISEIASQDGVSKQSIWVRLYGNKTSLGALKKLKDGR